MWAFENIVDIELFIEGNRGTLYQKIALPDPLTYPVSECHELSSLTSEIPSPEQSYVQDDESLYEVQDSWLSNDRLERIFKVKHHGSIHYYYAFKFNDCVILPAFLDTKFIFTISDYACLDVFNGFHHYYIFLDGGINDQLSDILGESFCFLGRYHFYLPSPIEEKTLTLDSSNKDIECFINYYNPLFLNLEFRREVARYRMDPSENLVTLNVNPSYYIVPKAATEKFCRGHPLIRELDIDDIAIVHRETKSRLEIAKLMEKVNTMMNYFILLQFSLTSTKKPFTKEKNTF